MKEKKCVVAVSEGIKDENNKLISEGNLDAFGHSQLGGVASYLCSIIEKELKIKETLFEKYQELILKNNELMKTHQNLINIY